MKLCLKQSYFCYDASVWKEYNSVLKLAIGKPSLTIDHSIYV